MNKLTKGEFEDVLDSLYPSNQILRDSKTEYLFMFPDRGYGEGRRQLKNQLLSLFERGTFDFRRTRS